MTGRVLRHWRGILAACVFVASVAMVIVGQQTVGWKYLGIQLLGLGGLIVLLGLYNRRYQ